MRFSNATCYYYEFTPEESLKHFSDSGWKYIELSHEHSEELLKREEKPEVIGRNFVKYANDLGIEIHQAHLALQCDIMYEKTVEEMKRWLEMYLAMGVKAAVLHPGGHVYCKEYRETSQEKLDELRSKGISELAKELKGTDTFICLENVGYVQSAEELNKIIEDSGVNNLAICLDTGHLNLSYHKMDGFLPYLKQKHFIKTAGERLKALHIHDNNGLSDQHIMPFTYGNINFREVVSALKEINYKGLFNLEIPSEARNIISDEVYPLKMRYIKSKYLFELFDYMMEEF